jgi:uncharacterized sulfatase
VNRLSLLLAVCAVSVLASSASGAEPQGRPNFLWITTEDISPNLGCYGDPVAITPVLDRMAKEGIRYTHAFTVAGVCAPSRSCLITGMYPTSLGSHNMRCTARLPEEVRCFPSYLRQAGYYCSNNAKEDYNFKTPAGSWDESSRMAHWRKRAKGQPFFAVFNNLVTHESQIRTPEEQFQKQTAKLTPAERHDPAKVAVPPFHPDTPAVRRDWARYHDLITAMDKQTGELLDQLKADGLEDDTIVFFFSDHGVGLPRGKRWLYDTGMQVPFLVRFPAKWQHLAPGKPGTVTDRLVSFVDFGPTLLSLAGIEPPKHMHGQAFLGKYARPAREAVYGIRDRMDERVDCTRAVRDQRWKYIRNYMPYRPHAQPIEYMEEMPTMKDWRRLAAEGKLTGPASLWMQPTKPFEELYDTEKDPHEIVNLAGSPEHRDTLERLRRQHLAWVRETRDLGLLPEAEIRLRSGDRAPYTALRDEKAYPLERVLEAATTAAKGPESMARLTELLSDPDRAVRYWAANGLGTCGEKAKPVLRQALADESPVVRVAAADALAQLGESEPALPVLRQALKHDNEWVRHAAIQGLDRMGKTARPALDDIKTATSDSNDFVKRVARHALKQLEP